MAEREQTIEEFAVKLRAVNADQLKEIEELREELRKLKEGPTVHVPINIHVGMTNQIATLQKEVEKLKEELKRVKSLRYERY